MEIFYTVKYTPQWMWLREEFERVDREKTPWLIVVMHAPIYNSNEAHYMEGESMRAVFESCFNHYKVDLVFAGHVHAYERSVWFFTSIFSCCVALYDVMWLILFYCFQISVAFCALSISLNAYFYHCCI